MRGSASNPLDSLSETNYFHSAFGESSNGRTTVSGIVSRGSNPCSPAIVMQVKIITINGTLACSDHSNYLIFQIQYHHYLET